MTHIQDVTCVLRNNSTSKVRVKVQAQQQEHLHNHICYSIRALWDLFSSLTPYGKLLQLIFRVSQFLVCGGGGNCVGLLSLISMSLFVYCEGWALLVELIGFYIPFRLNKFWRERLCMRFNHMDGMLISKGYPTLQLKWLMIQ